MEVNTLVFGLNVMLIIAFDSISDPQEVNNMKTIIIVKDVYIVPVKKRGELADLKIIILEGNAFNCNIILPNIEPIV